MTWREDYYLGSSDYPIWGDGFADFELQEDHEEPVEADHVEVLQAALQSLTEKQRFVLELSWGLRDGNVYTHYEIAEFMGIRQQSVYELYTKAMERVRGLLVNPKGED